MRQAYGRFLRVLFQQRRKTMRTTLPMALAEVAAGAAPALSAEFLAQRAEALTVDQLLALWRQVQIGPR